MTSKNENPSNCKLLKTKMAIYRKREAVPLNFITHIKDKKDQV